MKIKRRLIRPRVGRSALDMSITEHLRELRKRLIVCLVAVGTGAVAGFFLWDSVLRIATDPYCQAQAARGVEQIAGGSACQLYISNPLELVTTRLTVAGYIGVLLAMPVILWNIWRFVTPGLHKNEKRYAVPFVAASVVLFALGAVIAWTTFPKAISFFLAVGGEHVLTLFNPAPYLKLVFTLILLFGVVFEIPLLLVFLQLVGVVSSRDLRRVRRYAIVGNFVIAAVGTPSQDPYSLLALAVPMCLLFELAILTGRLLRK